MNPEALVNQLSSEWVQYGSYLKPKELEVIETETPFEVYFVYSLTHKQTLIDEHVDILKHAKEKIHWCDYFLDQGLPINGGYRPIPHFNIHTNVPHIPNHFESTNMSKLLANLQMCH